MKAESVQRLKMVTIEELLEKQANEEEFALVDTLPEDSFREGHLPGAVNMPSDEVAQRAAEELDKEATIVTYCANYTCQASTVAAKKLIELGYANVLDFKAGKQGWQKAGFELEK